MTAWSMLLLNSGHNACDFYRDHMDRGRYVILFVLAWCCLVGWLNGLEALEICLIPFIELING